jgi:hypothetical protein
VRGNVSEGSRRSCAALCWALAACGAGESGQSASSSAAPVSGDVAARSACDLVTSAELAAIAGEPIEVRPGPARPSMSKCEYWGTVKPVPYLTLTAYWTGGREQWDIQASGYGQAVELMRQAEGVELDSIVKPGPVPGLGDAAIFAELVPSVVLEGDRLLEMYLFYLPNAEQHFRPLAEKILGRMAR